MLEGKSSVLSHLFLQAADSGELLRRFDQARAQLAALIRERATQARRVAGLGFRPTVATISSR